MKRTLFALFVLSIILVNAAAASPAPGRSGPRNAVDFCPLTPFLDIWGVQYARRLSEHGDFVLSMSYLTVQYDAGRSHAPTLGLGYRHYFWKGLHLEYQLMPSHNDFYEKHERKYYSDFELWNEFRPGYTVDFKLGRQPFYLSLQTLVGFVIVPGNKPQSFRDEVKSEPVFVYPMFFLGWKF